MGLFNLFKKRGKDNSIFIITKPVQSGQPVKFCWRLEPDDDAGTNGWALFSGEENEEDMTAPILVGKPVAEKLAPGLKDIAGAPVGTEIGFQYDANGNHIGYFDMVTQQEMTAEEILKG